MVDIYIVIKEYSETLAKRQPWYSIKKFKSDLEKMDKYVEVINNINQIPNNFEGIVIKVFGIKDLIYIHNKKYKLIYFVTFPIYGVNKFFSFSLKTTIENWKDLKRIFFMSLVPKWILKKTFQQADDIIVISDRSEKYLSNIVDIKKYIPFIGGNWGGISKKEVNKTSKKTIGYFGPPFTTRSFDDIVDFFKWLDTNKYDYNKKIITRIERDELKDIEDKYLSKIKDDKSLKIISGFLDRDTLAKELLEIDVLILPFKIVMSELPVVVLEALELGIAVVTTKDSGIEVIAKNQKNLLILDNLNQDKFKIAVEFIQNYQNDIFDNVQNNINKINHKTLEQICQK